MQPVIQSIKVRRSSEQVKNLVWYPSTKMIKQLYYEMHTVHSEDCSPVICIAPASFPELQLHPSSMAPLSSPAVGPLTMTNISSQQR